MKDFYEVLGVNRDVTENDIKKAYRNLARQWHPDKFSTKSETEKKEAEEKFKEISEAYNTLSNSEKRRAYDMGGFNPFDDMGGFDPFSGFNPFDDMGGFNPFGRGRQMRQKGEDVHITVNVTLKEIFNEENKSVEYDVMAECPHCHGQKSLRPDAVKICPHCQGTGMLTRQNRKGNSVEIFQTPCPHCNATGTIIEEPCPHCNGNGVLYDKKVISIKVPKNATVNPRIGIQHMGNACPKSKNVITENGDLIITFNLIDDGYFKLIPPSNLLHVEQINLKDALLGTTINVKDIEGKDIKIKVDELTPPDKIYTFENKGMFDLFGNRGVYGVKLEYVMPNKLSSDLKKALKNLK